MMAMRFLVCPILGCEMVINVDRDKEQPYEFTCPVCKEKHILNDELALGKSSKEIKKLNLAIESW